MDSPAPDPSQTTSQQRTIWLLAFGEVLIWAALFYLFPALIGEWERDLGWSKTELSGAFTLALVVSALMAPVAGRLIDRGQGRTVLTASAVLGAILLAALSQVTQIWQFYALWFAMGFAMAGALYEACFAFVTYIFGAKAKRAITLITLIAGFAGTIAFPGAHALVELFGWRPTVLAFAGLALFGAAPLLWLAAGAAVPPAEALAETPDSENRSALARAMASPVFWLLGFAFAMIALTHSMLISHLLPLLQERGVHPEAAVLAASMIGPMQVAGRLAMLAIERRASIALISALSYGATAIACLALYGAAAVPSLIVGFVLLYGAGYGVTSIMRPVAIAEYLGRSGFGTISGTLALPFMGVFAVGPIIAALIWQVGGYGLVIGCAILASLLGLATFFVAVHFTTKRPAS